MAVEIKVPALGESVSEATVAKWLVKAGDQVTVDQALCELETDKVTVEVNASVAGAIVDLAVAEGATVEVGGVLCHIEAGAARAQPSPPPAPATPPRLKEAQNTAALLTTFNEVDMTAVMAMRDRLKEDFEKKHGARLGFMSFFVKACVAALKELPAVNAEIEGDELVYKNYYDIGVAVGTPQGLVVPVVREADTLSFAGIEKTIAELGRKARDGKLTIEDLSGGTFTISNGGVYGSLNSIPTP